MIILKTFLQFLFWVAYISDVFHPSYLFFMQHYGDTMCLKREKNK
jgi:hypothetical protein